MKKIGIIGAGISGISIGKLLNEECEITVFEKGTTIGGLVSCTEVDGVLYHKIGGHVFNSKRADVLDFFWGYFNKDTEFTLAERNAVILLDTNTLVQYPIENNLNCLNLEIQKKIISDLLQKTDGDCDSLGEFLRNTFGKSLYDLYFKPYNQKIWSTDPDSIPLNWLNGKLPMPSKEDIFLNNINKIKETRLVHSKFYYPIRGGSQFIVDRLASGIDVKLNSEIKNISRVNDKWIINDDQFDALVFCGNIKELPAMLDSTSTISYEDLKVIEDLRAHGTTSVLCEIEPNPFSWIYLPNASYKAHRIICTGNFSRNNNGPNGKSTGTVEFTGYLSLEEIEKELESVPIFKKYISHYYEKFTYPIQDNNTRINLSNIRFKLEQQNFYLLGRFAEWEYYNMDAAIGSAIDLKNFKLNKFLK